MRCVFILAVVGAWCGRALGTSVVLQVGPPEVLRTPDEQFKDLAKLGFPWTPKYVYMQLPQGPALRIHYIDEGPHDAPETLLLLHGTPAWSFLYRHMIPVFLSAGYRVVALDNIGFGRSDKLSDPEAYTHELHVSTALHVVRHLDLRGVTLVGQDLGGPVGLAGVAREPHRYRRLALLNTWLPQGDMLASFQSIKDHLPYLSWRALTKVLGTKTPVEGVFKLASDAPGKAAKMYGAPFPSEEYKAGPSVWPLMIPLYALDPMAVENRRVAAFLQTWSGPALVAYSDREVFTLPGEALLARVLPKACRATVHDAGHFLQEDQGAAVAALIMNFINGRC